MSATSRLLRFQPAIPFANRCLERVSELRKLGDLGVELTHFLMGHLCNFPTWDATSISHPKNSYEFLQRKAGGERILHEPYTIKCLRRIQTIAAVRAWRLREDAQLLVVSQRVRAHSYGTAEFSGPQGVL